MEDKEWLASDELDAIPLADAETERYRAKSWMDCAAQFCRDSEYWRNRFRKLEEFCESSEEIKRIVKLKAFL
jgi:hypothetical protein